MCGGKGSLTHWVEGTVEYAHETASLSLPRPYWPDKVRERLTAAARWQPRDVPPGGAVPPASTANTVPLWRPTWRAGGWSCPGG